MATVMRPKKMKAVHTNPDEPLIQLVDEIFTGLPFYGSKKKFMRYWPARDGS